MDLQDVDAADIGTGDGSFARELAERGARAAGIEISEDRVAAANAVGHGNNPFFMVGRGEKLPLKDDSRDLLCFIFSLHHIPKEVHERTLAEAVRVLRPGGRLHFSEPLPDDPERSAIAALDDETAVRTASHALLSSLRDRDGFDALGEAEYEVPYSYANFKEFVAALLQADPARVRRLPQARTRMERAFRNLAVVEDGRHVLPQPCRAYHFEASPHIAPDKVLVRYAG